MPTVDERLAALEAKVDAIADLRAMVLDMRADMNQRFAQVDSRFTQIEGRFTLIEGRFTHLEGEMNRRFASLDAKVDRNFVWSTGVMMTGFTAIGAALVGLLR